MMSKSPLRALSVLSLGALAFVSVLGCQGVITKGGGDGGSGGGGTSDPGTGGGGQCDPAACPAQAIVMSHPQYAAALGEDTSGQLLTDTQYLLYGGGTQTPACDAPYGGAACGGWTVAITIPTAYLTPGTYLLSDVDVEIYYTESMAAGDGSCAGTGGIGFDQGQIQILSVTNAGVDFKVSGVEPGGETFNINGAFSGFLCPDPQ